MSRAISVNLKRTTSTGMAGGQRNHDLRIGPQPKYVDEDRSQYNRVLIEPLQPAALRKRAEMRRAVSQPKRAMKSSASIAERGIITFGKDVQAAVREDPDRADRLYREVAAEVGNAFGVEVTGLVVHEDETGPHAHFWLDSFDKNGKPASPQIGRYGSRVQDAAARAARRVIPEIERGRSKRARIEAGEDPEKLKHRPVGRLHRDLGLAPGAGADEVAEAVREKREAEAAAAAARQELADAETERDEAMAGLDGIERRWKPKLGLLAAPGRKDQAQRDRAFEAALREIDRGTASPAEAEGLWTVHDRPRWEKIGRTLHPGRLGWGSAIWGALRKVAAVLGGEDLRKARDERDAAAGERNDIRTQLDAAAAAAGRAADLEETIRTTRIQRDRREAAAARALAAIAEGRTAPARAEGQWSDRMDPDWWASESHGLHPGRLGWGETLWAALRKTGQALAAARTERDRARDELAGALPADEARELREAAARRLLMLGAVSGNPEMIEQAIKEGAGLDRQLEFGRGMTALHAAVNWAQPGAVRQLLAAGADPAAADARGASPAEFGREQAAKAGPARREVLENIVRELEAAAPEASPGFSP